MSGKKRWLAVSLVGTFAAASVGLFGSGCGSSSTPGGGDASADTKGGSDHSADTKMMGSDAGPDSLPDVISTPDADAAPVCVTVSTTGTQILKVDTLKEQVQILDITNDKKFVIYAGYTAGPDASVVTNIYAVPVTGGSPITLLSGLVSSSMYAYLPVSLSYDTVFIWNNVTAAGVGTLYLWNTSMSGAATAVTGATASAANVGAASPMSDYIVYATGVNTTGTTGELVSATESAPGTTTTLESSIAVSSTSTSFVSQLEFVSEDYFVASYQATSGVTEVSAWSTAAFGTAIFTTQVQNPPSVTTGVFEPAYVADTAGTTISAVSSTGQAELIPVATGTAINVGAAGETKDTLIYPDGTGTLYGKPGVGLSSVSVTGAVLGTPVSLAPASGTGLYGGIYTEYGTIGVSPDDSQVLYYSTSDSSGAVSLYLVANSGTPTPIGIVTTPSAGIFGDFFTADSKYAVYITQLTNAPAMVQGGIGQLDVWDIAGAKTIAVSKGATCWDSNTLTGSTLLYNDNIQTSGSSATVAVADIKTVDVSAATLSPTVIQAEADYNYYLSADKTVLIYSITYACDTTAAGIYAYTLP
jgi:hypothetical protein